MAGPTGLSQERSNRGCFYDLVADIHPGHDTIVNFKMGTDILKIASDVDGITVASAAELVSAASVAGGSTVFHLGPNHDVTLQGIDIPSALISSIIVSQSL
jgi:hypothetical protein